MKMMMSTAQLMSRSQTVFCEWQRGQLKRPLGIARSISSLASCARFGMVGVATKDEPQCLHLIASRRICSAQKGHFLNSGRGGGEGRGTTSCDGGGIANTASQAGQGQSLPVSSSSASRCCPQCSQVQEIILSGNGVSCA